LGGEALCVLPWIHVEVTPEGVCKPCNVAREAIRDGSGFLEVARMPLESIRRSRYMRAMRAALASGTRIPVCSYCWAQEGRGETSQRQLWNRQFAPAFESLTERLESGVDPGEAMSVEYIQVSLGHVCNLACRMCNGTYSSRIEKDPVHGPWAPRIDRESEIVWSDFEAGGDGARSEERRPDWIDGTAWFDQPRFVEQDMLGAGSTLRVLYVTGGEPLISAAFYRILEEYVARGDARHMTVALNTSLFHGEDRMLRALELLLRFGHCHLGASIDGHGAVYEYIRHPARWSTVEANLRRVTALARERSNLTVEVTTVVQAYNCLDLPEVMRFADDLGIGCSPHVLDDPPQLRPQVLLPHLRLRAARRLQDYAATPAAGPTEASNRSHAARIARYLADIVETPDLPDLRHTFAAFTRQLDESRQQRLEQSVPELGAVCAS
jgi:pyruvate-formate lyase-activating enzyme